MSLYNYADTPNNNLLCCICRAPFNDPATTTTCQHTFCRDCITQALSHAPQCPVDRSPLSVQDLGPTSTIVQSMVDELLVECVYKDEGCRYRGERQRLAAHLKDACKFSEEGKARNETILNGTKDPKAFDKESVSVTGVELAADNASHASSGSTSLQEGKGSSPSNSDPRVGQLVEQNIILRHRVETLENVVQVFKKEMSLVRTILEPWIRNTGATARAASYSPPDTYGSGLTTPMTRTTSALDGSQSQTSTFVPTSAAQPGETSGSQSRTQSSPTSAHTSSEFAQLVGQSTADDIALYFPAEDEVRVRQAPPPPNYQQPQHSLSNTPQRQRQSGPAHAHHHSLSSIPNPMDPYSLNSGIGTPLGYPLGHVGYSLYSSPYAASGVIAGSSSISPPVPGVLPPPTVQPQPINLTVPELDTASPSLHHTLQGLHSSLGSLTSVVDEVNRKSEIALAMIGGGAGVNMMMGGGVVGEVLRLGEEVMGVRASVQGLRMQLHGMLMGAAVGSGGTPAMQNAYMGRPLNANSGGPVVEDSLSNPGALPFPGPMGGQSLNGRFGFPGIGITKL
ncbi:hypothetical protein FA15DRAFT_641849 [Coprinopsis marcescibilis]|uniref:RING-type domain-containing protein n=1 Tax=Coprinopsis marcescibilis TaxID=230819 RepID=A0A5C3KTM2_COPMA|nr:hypothetical protein FA15DRAFT_641849 [Coprinopsis marcescibilis]